MDRRFPPFQARPAVTTAPVVALDACGDGHRGHAGVEAERGIVSGSQQRVRLGQQSAGYVRTAPREGQEDFDVRVVDPGRRLPLVVGDLDEKRPDAALALGDEFVERSGVGAREAHDQLHRGVEPSGQGHRRLHEPGEGGWRVEPTDPPPPEKLLEGFERDLARGAGTGGMRHSSRNAGE